MNSFWDERYSEPGYAYGSLPNAFFEQQLRALKPGSLLLPAEGEGRNAVFAATMGWQVHAFDQSVSGREKALDMASQKSMEIEYQIGSIEKMAYPDASFDAIGLIYVHLSPPVRFSFHQRLMSLLKPGGVIILEGFSISNLPNRLANPAVGGPDNPALLFSKEMLANDFNGLKIIQLEEVERVLAEGKYHRGNAKLIRLIAEKS